jgi:hypothetical protein
MDASHTRWFSALFDQFCNAVNNNEYVGQEARDAYFCIQTIEAIYQSAMKGSLEIPLSAKVPLQAKAGWRDVCEGSGSQK